MANKPNWANQTIWTGDNLDIMRGMNSASVDLIYLDPPFNSKADYAAPVGSKAAGAAFKDTWGLDDINLAWHGLIKYEQPGLYKILSATQEVHGDSMMSYLIYMAVRIMEMKRLLKPTGSIYLHCDDNANAYLRLLMDAVFGRANFRNEIIWKRASGKGLNPTKYVRNCDRILYYSNGEKPVWNQGYEPFEKDYGANWKEDRLGRWAPGDLTGGKAGGPEAYEAFKGVKPARGRAWAPPRREKFPSSANLPSDYESLNPLEKCYALDDAGLIHWPKKEDGKPQYKKYLATLKGLYVSDLIQTIPPVNARSKERQDYPTQKPRALLQRIIRASSNADDVVLDPFCGCATTCIAAEFENRQWVGIDISPKAADLVKDRMKDEVGMFFKGPERTDIPKRTDLGKIPKYNSDANKRKLYGEQGGFCNGCGVHFQPRHLTVDHIIAVKKGGTDHISNLQLLCGNCNSTKGTRGQDWLMKCLLDKGFIKREALGKRAAERGV